MVNLKNTWTVLFLSLILCINSIILYTLWTNEARTHQNEAIKNVMPQIQCPTVQQKECPTAEDLCKEGVPPLMVPWTRSDPIVLNYQPFHSNLLAIVVPFAEHQLWRVLHVCA